MNKGEGSTAFSSLLAYTLVLLLALNFHGARTQQTTEDGELDLTDSTDEPINRTYPYTTYGPGSSQEPRGLTEYDTTDEVSTDSTYFPRSSESTEGTIFGSSLSSTESTDSTDGSSSYGSSDFFTSTEPTEGTSDFTDSTGFSDSSSSTEGFLDHSGSTEAFSDSSSSTEDSTTESPELANVTTPSDEQDTDEPVAEMITDGDDLITLPWYVTDPPPPYEWVRPIAWDSDRLYPFGPDQGDNEMLSESANWFEKFYTCKGIQLNGGAGAQFFGSRYQKINICNNGLLSLKNVWRPTYPMVFESNEFFDDMPYVAPFWAQTDEAIMSLLTANYSADAASAVFYHVYDQNNGGAILTRAQRDISESAYAIADFTPTWVLVVTWINIAYSDNDCRLIMFLNEVYHFVLPDTAACLEQAKEMPLNHFQAVFITDGVYSFIKYNYPEEGINWAYPGISSSNREKLGYIMTATTNLQGAAVAGYTSGDMHITNQDAQTDYLPFSNSLLVVDLDDLPGNMNDNRTGEWVFRVEDSNGTSTAAVECEKWVSTQNVEEYQEYSDEHPCPTTFLHAWFDRQFNYDGWAEDWSCVYFAEVFSDGNKYQRCCYSWNPFSLYALVTAGPYAGFTSDVDKENQNIGYQTCCVESGLCRKFYSVRPSSDGRDYDAPSLRAMFGDPHIMTSDGLGYTFNGQGEYLFTQIGNETTVQARTERVQLSNDKLNQSTANENGVGQATFFSAVCVASEGYPKVQVQLNKMNVNETTGVENLMQLIINGTEVDMTNLTENANVTETLPGVDSGIRFLRTNVSVTVVWATGFSIEVGVTAKMMSITPGLPDSFKGRAIGLTGLFDGDTSNDLAYMNGSTWISANSSEAEIFDWASTYAVSEEDSIMYYTEANTDWWTYNNNSFVPVFTDNSASWDWSSTAFRDEAMALCGDDMACLYDAFITGDLDIGANTQNINTENANNNQIISNSPPFINGSDTLLITVGEQFTYTVTANDTDGDAITVTTNINTTVTISGEDVTITGIITNTTAFSLMITAQDPTGASSTHSPLVMLCSCSNNGTCVSLSQEELQIVSGDSVVLECICPTGYDGDLCDDDLDACALTASACYPGVLCSDEPAPADATGYTCGDCPAGYTGDGKTCTDIDECALGSCDHICVNSPGSFLCTCRSGYELNADGTTCDDIDECATFAPCHHVCNNTAGSFVCSCDENYDLAADNVNCEPSNPCPTPSPCDDVNGFCNLLNATTEECSCKKGFMLHPQNQSVCEEIDECALGIDACDQNCTNTDGGYTCSCMTGYTLDRDGFGCIDDNECVLGTYTCHVTQTCSNTPGSYECVCTSDQVLTRGQCVSVSFSDPVANVTTQPSTAQIDNSIAFYLSGLTIAEYTKEKEILLFTLLANELTTICANGSCSYVADSAARRKRSTSVTFYKEYLSRLPGYPRIDGSGNLELAIHSTVPAVGVVPASKLLEAVQASNTNIESSLGVTFVGARLYSEPSTTIAQTTVFQTSTAVTRSNAGLIAGMVVLAIVLVVGVVGLVVFLKVRANKRAKTFPEDEETESEPRLRSARKTGSTVVAPVSTTEPVVSHATSSYDQPTIQKPLEPLEQPGSRQGSAGRQAQVHSRTHTPTQGTTPLDGEHGASA